MSCTSGLIWERKNEHHCRWDNRSCVTGLDGGFGYGDFMSDDCVIYIEPTKQHALNKFREIQQDLGGQIDKAQLANLLIESGGVTFRFVSQTNLDILHGLRPTHVMVDNRCELRIDQHMFLDSLIRNRHE